MATTTTVQAGIDYQALAKALMSEAVGAQLMGHVGSLVNPNQTKDVETGVGSFVDVSGKKSVGEGSVGVLSPIGGGGLTYGNADAASEAGSGSESSGVSGGVPASVSEVVRRNVVFGGQDGEVEHTRGGEVREGTTKVVGQGFFSRVVHDPRVKEFRGVVGKVMGRKLPKHANEEFALVTFAAGSMPSEVYRGVERLKTLAMIGDAAITQHLLVRMYVAQVPSADIQGRRSRFTSDSYLREKMISNGFCNYIVYPSGVDVATSKTTATAFEAIVGVLVMHCPYEDVDNFLHNVGLF